MQNPYGNIVLIRSDLILDLTARCVNWWERLYWYSGDQAFNWPSISTCGVQRGVTVNAKQISKSGHYIDILSEWPFHRNRGRKWDNVRPKLLYFGTPMIHKGEIFPGGGPGYTMNRAALELFGTAGLTFLPILFIGSFFSIDGVILSNTIDENGGRRYLALSADDAGRYHKGQPGQDSPHDLKIRFGLEIAYGEDSVSEQGIAIHLKTGGNHPLKYHTSSDLMRRYHAIVNDLCD